MLQINSDDNFSISGTPPEIVDVANILKLLPPKSKEKYEVAYKRFMEYCEDKKVNSCSENILIEYFMDLSKKMKPSTLWATYSMLKATVTMKNNVDISKYHKLRAFIKRQSEGYRATRSQILTKKQIQQFLLEAPDDTFLMTKILTFLWFCGRQTASYREVADKFNITISSLHRINSRVALFLSNLSPQIITWPSDEEKVIIEQHFNENGFPGTIGAIDGCHIKIDKPEVDPDSYINKKGFYSIQMQVVCDNEKRIRDVFVGSPGSLHDSRVLKESPLFQSLEEKCGPYFILGDNGYPLLKKLLTPFRGQLTRKQINYNTKLARNRNVIEHCFGIMKQKFRLLNHVKLRNIQFIVHFIRAMCVLHNISINDKLPLKAVEECNNLPAVPTKMDIDVNMDEDMDDKDAQRIRDDVVNSLQIL